VQQCGLSLIPPSTLSQVPANVRVGLLGNRGSMAEILPVDGAKWLAGVRNTARMANEVEVERLKWRLTERREQGKRGEGEPAGRGREQLLLQRPATTKAEAAKKKGLKMAKGGGW
jgi:hypothetical protein